MCKPGQLSRHSDSLRPQSSGDRIPVVLDISNLYRQALGPTQPPVRRVQGLYPRGKVARAWRLPPTSPSKGNVKSTAQEHPEGE
jgi:hypothetical protein